MHFENISAKIAKNRLSLGFDKMKSQIMKAITYVSADEAVRVVKSHDHIHLSSVASVPHILIQALCRRADAGEIEDVRFHHFHTEGPAPYSEPKYDGILFDQGFFLGPNVRANVNAGYADYLPVHLGESQKLYRSGALRCDVAMVQVSLPDENGYVSLGTSVDCSLAAQLVNHKDIGVHTEMFADGILRLIKKGVVNGARKKIDTGKVVASFLLGSNDVYRFIDHNPDVLMKDIKYTNDPWIIAQNPGMMAINSATEVDLTGQISADSIGTRIFSGTGGQLDFVKGATMSEGGKSVTAFASRTNKGQAKIVPMLNPGAGVVTPRADAHWIVTEYGAVDLYGKSLQERAKLLITIAHPDDREMLDKAAFDRFGPHYAGFKLYLP